MERLLAGAKKLGISLTPIQQHQFLSYYRELVDWNSRINLTAVMEWENVQVRHFLDSLTVSQVIPPEVLSSGRVLDVGSGAGFPGIPLKIAFPGIRLSLIESVAKKTAFLSHVTQVLGLEGIEVHTGRSEDLAHDPDLREGFDVVMSRAVGRIATLAELTLPFCRLGGLVIAQKSRNVKGEIEEAMQAIETVGGHLKEVREVALDGPAPPGVLVVLEKRCLTPVKYPRRPGIPAKRPL